MWQILQRKPGDTDQSSFICSLVPLLCKDFLNASRNDILSGHGELNFLQIFWNGTESLGRLDYWLTSFGRICHHPAYYLGCLCNGRDTVSYRSCKAKSENIGSQNERCNGLVGYFQGACTCRPSTECTTVNLWFSVVQPAKWPNICEGGVINARI